MGKIDVHHHLINEPDYVPRLLSAMDELDIERVALSVLGLHGSTNLGDLSAGNDEVLRAFHQAPDRIIPIYTLRLDAVTPDEADRELERGFDGVKITRPQHNYDHESYDPIYAALADRNVPVLFHTGVVLVTDHDRTDDVSSDRMRPIRMDRIARTFPTLTIIMAHLGVPWFEEAATMLRFHANVFADLTGDPDGWLKRKRDEFFTDMLGWPDTADKIVFGTDVNVTDLPRAVARQKQVIEAITAGAGDPENFWGRTARQWWPGH